MAVLLASPGLRAQDAEDDSHWILASLAEDDLCLVSPKGGDLVFLELPPGEKANLALSPDRKRVAFVHLDPEEARYFLMSYRFSGHKLEKLAELAWQPPRPLAFSPDGRWIVVVDGNAVTHQHRIVLVDLKGGPNRTVAEDASVWDGPVFVSRGALAWATALDRKYTNKLLVMGVFNGTERKIHVSSRQSESKSEGRVRNADNSSPLSVSPDGSRLLWLDWGKAHTKKRQLVSVGLKTGSFRYLTDTEGGCYGASFSPDGKWIAYVAPSDQAGKTAIHVTDRAGGKNEVVVHFVKQPYRGWMFSWSPDSRSIAYPGKEVGGTVTPRELWVVDVKEKKPERLTENEVCECYPVWVVK